MTAPAPLAERTSSIAKRPALVVVVPAAVDGRRTASLLTLVAWLVDTLPEPPTVVCWQSGPLVAAFAALAPVIDAGAVNEHPAARALAAIGLSAVARPVKHQQLRRALAPIAHCDHILLAGEATTALLDWLPRRPERRVALWLDDDADDGEQPPRPPWPSIPHRSYLASAVAAGNLSQTLETPADRIQVVGEPLIGPVPLDPPTRPVDHGGSLVAVVGVSPLDTAALPAILAVVAASGGGSAPVAAWVHDDVRRSWSRWTDPRFAGLESSVLDWTVEECRRRLDTLTALVVAGPTSGALATEAAAAGVPVLAVGETAEGAAARVASHAALRDALRDLVTDPTLWEASSAAAVQRAAPHRIDHVGRAVLRSLDVPVT